MRFAAALAFVVAATSARAWTFAPNPVCTLFHETPEARVAVTFDPSLPEPYAIAITLKDRAWPASPTFAIRFDGQRGNTIGTDRQRLSDGNRTLTVSDTGFGNVLDGIEYNTTATALSEGEAVVFLLDGAAPEVEKFRACKPATGV